MRSALKGMNVFQREKISYKSQLQLEREAELKITVASLEIVPILFSILGAPIAEWVKHCAWGDDLAVPGSSLA